MVNECAYQISELIDEFGKLNGKIRETCIKAMKEFGNKKSDTWELCITDCPTDDDGEPLVYKEDHLGVIQVYGRHDNCEISVGKIELYINQRGGVSFYLSGWGCEEFDQSEWNDCSYDGTNYFELLCAINGILSYNTLVENGGYDD